MDNEKDTFEEIMDVVGYGKFQTRFNYLFNLFLVGIVTIPYFNIVIALSIPEHWCHVPGRNDSGYSEEEWKNLTIPWLPDKNNGEFSRCTMYNDSIFSNTTENRTAVDCQYGWDYNRTWFRSTMPSEEDWVCDKELYVTETLICSSIGELVGTVVFGQLGDRIGRRPVFLISSVSLLLGRLASLYTTNMYPLFMTTIFIGSFASFSIFQSPLIIALEITREDDRATVAFLQNMGWNVAFCLMPLIYWYFGDWYPFMLATTAPILLVLAFQKLLIESPRWLASKGKDRKCIKILKNIAKVNGTELREDLEKMLAKCKIKPENSTSHEENLFSSCMLIRTTVYVSITWIATNITYGIFYLNTSNIGGNPFLNFFWQALAEIPGNFVARYFCDTIGRRLTRFVTFLLATAGSIGTIFFISSPGYETLVLVLSAFVKFNAAITMYVLGLHTLEIYPTALRQTGLSIATITSSVLAMGSPYIVYLGTSVDARIPYILCTALCIAGALAVIPIPETLHQNLPETIKEAEDLGKGQTFWKIPKKIDHEYKPTELR